MAWSEHVVGRPGAALNWAAGMVAMVGLAALGVGIGTGCTLLLAAAYAVIFVAGLVPALVDWRDSIRRCRTAVCAEAGSTTVARTVAGRKIECETGDRLLVWIEPERHRLH